jgi:hypothetical protein
VSARHAAIIAANHLGSASQSILLRQASLQAMA